MEGRSYVNKIHKINLIVIWVCTALLTIFMVSTKGFCDTTIKSSIGMTCGSIIATIIYLSKTSDVFKGSGITIVIAMSCLATSIAEGGNAGIYIISYIILGMALIYFNKKIVIYYLAVYIPASIIAGAINCAYIVGPDGNKTLCAEEIFAYTIIGILMVVATNRGEKLIKSSKDMLLKITENNDKNNNVIQKLNSSMEESSQNIGYITDNTKKISDETYGIEKLTKNMNNSAGKLSSLVSDTMKALSQNIELNKELEIQFEEVENAVKNGNDGAFKVKDTLDIIQQTVLEASKSTEILLEKISLVDKILKEINKITLKTNMLSINASIEAAKSGEYGKGFSVVASEIKSLAEESSESSKHIQDIISEITNQVDDVAVKTSAGTKSAIDGLESMKKLLIILDKIKSNNDVVSNVVTNETKTNDEVNNKFNYVTSEISTLLDNILNISDSIESISKDIHNQNDSIQNMNKEIGNMKVITNSLSTTE